MTRTTSREAMIDAAEQIVAEKGMPALTLKDVQIAAGQSNKSAAKYHFGSREGLIGAVIEARGSAVNARRQALLDEMEGHGTPLTARQAAEAMVWPLASETLSRPGSRYARFLVQALFDPALADLIKQHLSSESYRRVHQLMVDACLAPHETAEWRAVNVVVFSISVLAAYESSDRTADQRRATVTDLIDSCVAILETSPSTDTGTQGVSP
ncbi:TetR/AcrR family transcriptional regulator [Rhodococcus sp. NPDC059234]|uniref:TetR/AcrR family transcriptional regulator n=1 Tax=Rhodococcus sp. NPDC059234 TaxID=3346781 RepID=UPI0036733E9D